jgi:hypothetical protein
MQYTPDVRDCQASAGGGTVPSQYAYFGCIQENRRTAIPVKNVASGPLSAVANALIGHIHHFRGVPPLNTTSCRSLAQVRRCSLRSGCLLPPRWCSEQQELLHRPYMVRPRSRSIFGGAALGTPFPCHASSAAHAAHTGFRVNPSNGFGFLYGLGRRFGFFHSLKCCQPGRSRTSKHQHTATCRTNTATSKARITLCSVIRPPTAFPNDLTSPPGRCQLPVPRWDTTALSDHDRTIAQSIVKHRQLACVHCLKGGQSSLSRPA